MCAQGAQQLRFILRLFQNRVVDCLRRPYPYFPIYAALDMGFKEGWPTYAASRQPRAVRMDVN